MSWDQIIKDHLSLALKVYKPEQIAELGRLSGINIMPSGDNSATKSSDVAEYLKAIRQALGEVPYISAKLKCTNAAKKFGLRLDL